MTIKNALQQRANGNVTQQDPSTAMRAMLKQMASQIAMALPNQMSTERFQRVALTAFNENKDLQQCDVISFLAAMMQSAQLGLEPNTPLGQAYLIPYNTKRGKMVQFQIG